MNPMITPRRAARGNLTVVNQSRMQQPVKLKPVKLDPTRSKGREKPHITDLKKSGVNAVDDETVKNNLLGVSRFMKDPNWQDSSGQPGKGLGVYRFADKYGANVDGYSPIYTPDAWVDASNSEWQLGTRGVFAWAGLLVVLLGVGINLIVSTSQLGV